MAKARRQKSRCLVLNVAGDKIIKVPVKVINQTRGSRLHRFIELYRHTAEFIFIDRPVRPFELLLDYLKGNIINAGSERDLLILEMECEIWDIPFSREDYVELLENQIARQKETLAINAHIQGATAPGRSIITLSELTP